MEIEVPNLPESGAAQPPKGPEQEVVAPIPELIDGEKVAQVEGEAALSLRGTVINGSKQVPTGPIAPSISPSSSVEVVPPTDQPDTAKKITNPLQLIGTDEQGRVDASNLEALIHDLERAA